MRIPFTVALTLLLLPSQHAFAGASNSIAIAVDTSALSQEAAAEIRGGVGAQVLAGLLAAKIDVIPNSEERIVTQARDCDGVSCLQELATSAELALVVQVRIEAKKKAKKRKADYSVSMLVVRGAPDAQAWREESDCPGCEADETKHISYLLASMIGERVGAEPRRITRAVAQLPAAPPPAPPVETPAPPPPSPSIISIPPPTPNPGWSVSRYVSVPLLAGGVAMVASGIYLLHINGQGTCDLAAPKQACPQRYKTQGLGVGLIAGGGLASIAGLAGLIVFTPEVRGTRMSIACGVSSISASGAF